MKASRRNVANAAARAERRSEGKPARSKYARKAAVDLGAEPKPMRAATPAEIARLYGAPARVR